MDQFFNNINCNSKIIIKSDFLMKPLRSHTEQKSPNIQPFLRLHYLLKFLILMSFRGASPPRAPTGRCPGPAGGPQTPRLSKAPPLT